MDRAVLYIPTVTEVQQPLTLLFLTAFSDFSVLQLPVASLIVFKKATGD
jgi:hypothetical protein